MPKAQRGVIDGIIYHVPTRALKKKEKAVMALPKRSFWNSELRPNGRVAIFPCGRADFSNLEELYDMLAGPEEVTVIGGQVSGFPEFPYPHVTLTTQTGDISYMFIKQSEDTYVLKVIRGPIMKNITKDRKRGQ